MKKFIFIIVLLVSTIIQAQIPIPSMVNGKNYISVYNQYSTNNISFTSIEYGLTDKINIGINLLNNNGVNKGITVKGEILNFKYFKLGFQEGISYNNKINHNTCLIIGGNITEKLNYINNIWMYDFNTIEQYSYLSYNISNLSILFGPNFFYNDLKTIDLGIGINYTQSYFSITILASKIINNPSLNIGTFYHF